MSSVGLSEWVLLALLGLIVLGPERLPRIASQIGNWIGQARRMTRVMKRQLEQELDLENTNSIRPRSTSSSQQSPGPAPESAHSPANEHDETYSPAHDAGSVGTGVGDDDWFDTEEPDDQPDPEHDDVTDDEKESRP
jgi:sec-independent protein translocase protein TatB